MLRLLENVRLNPEVYQYKTRWSSERKCKLLSLCVFLLLNNHVIDDFRCALLLLIFQVTYKQTTGMQLTPLSSAVNAVSP